MTTCLYCHEPIHFPPWQHEDGTTVRTRQVNVDELPPPPPGQIYLMREEHLLCDDHVATPDWGSGNESPWVRSNRSDPVARLVADRHYNRQKVGSPQFVPPGRCLVLRTVAGDALWVTSWPFAEYTRHDWPGAWVNSCFRREGGDTVASDMIRWAVAHTCHTWPAPDLGMVTMINRRKVRSKRDPGYCYLMAGFKWVGRTKGGLDVLQMMPEDMPAPERIPELQEAML